MTTLADAFIKWSSPWRLPRRSESVGGGRGGDQVLPTLQQDLKQFAVQLTTHTERMQTHDAPGQRGVVPRELQEFHGAVQCLGQQFADLPGSVGELRLALEKLIRNGVVSPRQKLWFQDGGGSVRPDIWTWLQFLQPDESLDLEETIGGMSLSPLDERSRILGLRQNGDR